jgi:phosphoglycerate dehydrogenase-like enzyme
MDPTSEVFRLALTGDFLNEAGDSAYGDIRLDLLDGEPRIQYRFLEDQQPRAGDSTFWTRFYSLEIEPRHLKGIDGLIVLRPWVKPATFADGAETLTVIGRSGAGYDKIDVAACTANDVALFNAPSALNHSTASAALLLMLALAKKLPQQDRVVREGRWDRQAEVLGHELEGRTLGIVGLGRSGRELVRLVEPFRMRLLAYSPHADREQAAELGVELTSLEEVFAESDFVSVHSRLTPENRHSIHIGHFSLMKPTAYFINIARGELIDEPALVRTLDERRIAGAGLDVFATEPLPAEHPLTKLDNVILAPHWLCSTADVWRQTGEAMARGMIRAAYGQVPENVVNPEVLERPRFREKLARFRR